MVHLSIKASKDRENKEILDILLIINEFHVRACSSHSKMPTCMRFSFSFVIYIFARDCCFHYSKIIIFRNKTRYTRCYLDFVRFICKPINTSLAYMLFLKLYSLMCFMTSTYEQSYCFCRYLYCSYSLVELF